MGVVLSLRLQGCLTRLRNKSKTKLPHRRKRPLPHHRPLLRRDFPQAGAVAVRKYQLIKVDLKDDLMEIKELIMNFVNNHYVLLVGFLVGFIGSVLTIWSFFKKKNNRNNSSHQKQSIKGNHNQQAGRDIVSYKDKP
jgi:hypothetical protein